MRKSLRKATSFSTFCLLQDSGKHSLGSRLLAAEGTAGMEEVPVPPQDRKPFMTDLRNIAMGPKGFRVSRKRKLEEQEQQVCYTCVYQCSSLLRCGNHCSAPQCV